MGLDLFLFCFKAENHLDLFIHYNPDQYDKKTVERLSQTYYHVLKQLINSDTSLTLKDWSNQQKL